MSFNERGGKPLASFFHSPLVTPGTNCLFSTLVHFLVSLRGFQTVSSGVLATIDLPCRKDCVLFKFRPSHLNRKYDLSVVGGEKLAASQGLAVLGLTCAMW